MEQKLETIFDYNPTEEELDILICSREDYEAQPDEYFSRQFSLRKKENYIADLIKDAPNEDAIHDSAMSDLFSLFWMREGKNKAREYAYKIKDPQYRMDKLNLLGGF